MTLGVGERGERETWGWERGLKDKRESFRKSLRKKDCHESKENLLGFNGNCRKFLDLLGKPKISSRVTF